VFAAETSAYFCERATVVGAVGANGKEFITAAAQNQFFAVGLARYDAASGDRESEIHF
jgi:hypothetical protein